MMMRGLVEIDWKNYGEAIPAFITIALMPLTYSIAYGIIGGLVPPPLQCRVLSAETLWRWRGEDVSWYVTLVTCMLEREHRIPGIPGFPWYAFAISGACLEPLFGA